jgi:Flp pilus assembly protein TadD
MGVIRSAGGRQPRHPCDLATVQTVPLTHPRSTVTKLTQSETIERARRFLREGRDAENLEFLESAVARYPQDPEIRLLYATALVPFRPDKAPWQVATAIELDKNDPWRLTRAASLMFHLGELEASRSYAARAAELARMVSRLSQSWAILVGSWPPYKVTTPSLRRP